MSEIETIEQRLQRFADGPADSDWHDVLRRSGMTAGGVEKSWRRPRLTRRRLVAAVVVVVLALVLPALALSGVLDSVFGVSNHGKRVHARPGIRKLLEGSFFIRHGIPYNAERPDSFTQLAFRHGIGVYTARTKKGNRLCYYVGRHLSLEGLPPHRLYLDGSFGCAPDAGNMVLPQRLAGSHHPGRKNIEAEDAWVKNHPFPSPARPIMDLSEFSLVGGRIKRRSLVGVAANGVRSVQLLALSDCHPVVTVPVIDNVYIGAHPPDVPTAFFVARDASGKVIWHSARIYMNSPNQRVPIDRDAPRNCGLR